MASAGHPGIDDVSFASSSELDHDLTDELRARVKGELEPGERLLWTGQNRVRRSVLGLGHLITALVAFGLFAFTFLLFGLFNGPRQNGEGIATVLGLVTGFIGFCVVVGLFSSVVDAFTHRRADRSKLYALTDRRAIIWEPDYQPRGIAVHSIYRGEVARVHRVEYPNRKGDLRFSFINPDSGLDCHEFTGISEVRRVELLVRQTLIEPPHHSEA